TGERPGVADERDGECDHPENDGDNPGDGPEHVSASAHLSTDSAPAAPLPVTRKPVHRASRVGLFPYFDFHSISTAIHRSFNSSASYTPAAPDRCRQHTSMSNCGVSGTGAARDGLSMDGSRCACTSAIGS